MGLVTTLIVAAVALWVVYVIVCVIIIVLFHSDVTTALIPPMPPEAFSDCVIWITGAGSGLGEKLALRLAEKSSAKLLILSSRKNEELDRVKEACLKMAQKRDNKQIPLQVKVLPLDLSNLESIPGKVQEARKLVEASGDDAGDETSKNTIDVLINAAGVTTRSFASDSNFELDQYVTKVNYLGPVCLIKSLFPNLPGKIVQLGSITSKLGAPVRTAYSGSKFALQGWLEGLAIESILQQRDLTVVACILGSIDTGLGSRALVNVDKDGKIETLQQDDQNLSKKGLDAEWTAERILAVAHAKTFCYETWIAPKHELLPILYFVTYFRTTAVAILPKLLGPQYAVTKKTKAE